MLAVEAEVPGGQAGTSSMIRNYLGFPRGISGMRLTQRARVQAARFGARFYTGRPVDGLAPAPFGDRITAPLTEGLADDFLEVFERRTARVFDLPKKVGQQVTEAFPVSRHGASCRAKFPGKISNIPEGGMC